MEKLTLEGVLATIKCENRIPGDFEAARAEVYHSRTALSAIQAAALTTLYTLDCDAIRILCTGFYLAGKLVGRDEAMREMLGCRGDE